jgi:hypothetical protein
MSLIVSHKQNRALRSQVLEQLENRLGVLILHPCGWFIDTEKGWVGTERTQNR